MERILCFLLVLASAAQLYSLRAQTAPQQTAVQEEVLSLDAATSLALANSRLLKITALDTKKSDDQIAALRTKRLPSSKVSVFGYGFLTDLNFTFRQGQFGFFPATGPVPPQQTDITTPRRLNALVMGQIAQPLSQLYKVNLALHLQELARASNQETIRKQRQELVQNVRQVYYSILQNESALEASREAIQQYRELDRVTADFVVQQVALKSDALDVKARLAQEEYNALTIRNVLAGRKESLNQLLARDIRTPFRTQRTSDAGSLESDLESAHFRSGPKSSRHNFAWSRRSMTGA